MAAWRSLGQRDVDSFEGVSLANNDVLGARARANGSVEVFKNGALVGIADASGWSGSAGGGVIGLRVTNGTSARLDDFGGGASTCAGSAPTPTPQPTPTQTPTPTPVAMGAGKVLAKLAVIAPQQQGVGTNVCAKYGFGGTDCVATSYYNFGGQRVAMRVQRDVNTTGTVYWLHGDHLGSASLTTDVNGGKVAEVRFKPWGEARWSNGAMPTDRRFTGMTTHAALGGLVTMGVREYLPVLGRWLSADSIVPRAGNPQALNRYSFVFNRPINFIDPSGHEPCAVYNGSECVVRYYDPNASNASRYAYQLVENQTLNCEGCVTSDITAGLIKVHQDQINDNFELQFGIASMIAGGRLVFKGGRWVLAAAKEALTDIGYAILARCVANPICSTWFLGISSQLSAHKDAGGHTTDRHVAKTTIELSQRLATEKNLKAASAFTDLSTAQAAVNQALSTNQAKIAQWLQSGSTERLVLDGSLPESVGSVLQRGASGPIQTGAFLVVLERSESVASGWYILTAYPIAP